MGARWNIKEERYDPSLPDLLAEKFESIRTADGFEGFEYQEYITVLQSIVHFSASLPNAVHRGIVHGGVFAAAQAGKITADTVIREISKLESKYKTRDITSFVLATSLSIKYFEGLSKTEIAGCRITLGPDLPKKYMRARLTLEPEATLIVLWKPSTHYSAVRVPRHYSAIRAFVTARSEPEAFESALDAVDLLRGIWNLYLNRRVPIRKSSGRRKPINKILLGPVHTLHIPSNAELTPTWSHWCEEGYVELPVTTTSTPSKKWADLRKFEGRVRGKLLKHNYRDKVEEAIRRYTRALDSTDWSTAFVRLWGLLETLTSTSKNDSHSTTVKRALFLQPDRRYHGQVLNHLRDIRNKNVHYGLEAKEIETVLYQVKHYVETMLLFHIYNHFDFSSIQAAAEFLDLPPDLPELEKKASALEHRMELVKKAVRLDSL